MQLNYPKLFQTQAYINGVFVDGDSGTFEVTNPYDGSVIAEVADCTPQQAEQAIQAAAEGFKVWSKYTAGKRSRILRKWYELQLEHADDLARLLTTEQGKPVAEAKGEIRYGASFVEWFAEEAKRIYGDTIPGHASDKRIVTIKQPIGVVAAITPWNFPSAMITRKVAPALASGCTVVIKPAELTPLSALALAQLAQEAGFPAGVLNIVTSNNAPEIGSVMTESKIVRKLSFTGSTKIGKLLMRQCADTVKRLSLELGGNAPFIVFDDADLEEAVSGAVAAKYRNAGQTCICANRIFVQSGIYDAFTEKFAAAVQKQKVGNGLDEGVVVGPMVEEKAVQFVEEVVADAKNKGGKVLTGGQRHGASEGLVYEPTVIIDARVEMSVFSEEIFGPIAPVFKFETEEDVIALANDTNYGLASYFYGRDYARIWRVAEALEYGMVGINTGMISTAVAPFGGIKESGFGREGSKYGIDDYVEIKYLCWGGVK